MGKRYYCDYCDKSFADNPMSRKTHLTGNAHLQNKKAHYAALRNEEEILKDDQSKKPCRMFLSTRTCKYGDNCQYSHLTNEDRAQLADVIRQKQEAAKARLDKTSSVNLSDPKLLGSWLEARTKKQKLEQDDGNKKSQVDNDVIPEYKLADCLTVFSDLPPSLLPPSKEAILNCDFAEWG